MTGSQVGVLLLLNTASLHSGPPVLTGPALPSDPGALWVVLARWVRDSSEGAKEPFQLPDNPERTGVPGGGTSGGTTGRV